MIAKGRTYIAGKMSIMLPFYFESFEHGDDGPDAADFDLDALVEDMVTACLIAGFTVFVHGRLGGGGADNGAEWLKCANGGDGAVGS